MKRFSIVQCVLIGMVALGAPVFAQTTVNFSQTITTGIVSLSLNQGAQLNVLNLNPPPVVATAVAPVCEVELEFRDAQNNILKQILVANLAPGDATSLTLERSDVPKVSTAHLDVRGVVHTGPLTPGAGAVTTPIANTCTVMPTLEVFNVTTGDTDLITSDTRTVSAPVAVPLVK